MRLLFTRHGESEANVQQIISNRFLPHKLTQKGREQAVFLAERLVTFNIHTIFASPIMRAQETAVIVANALGYPFTPTPALREFDCGMMEGRGDKAAWEAHHAVVQAWDNAHDYERRILPDGESFHDLKARFVPFIRDLVAQYAPLPGDLLLISHGGLLHHMLPLVLANVDRAFTQQHPLKNCALVVAAPVNDRLLCREWDGVVFT